MASSLGARHFSSPSSRPERSGVEGLPFRNGGRDEEVPPLRAEFTPSEVEGGSGRHDGGEMEWRAPSNDPHERRLNPRPAFLISPHVRPPADRRFRFPSHPADRPAPARSGGLLRDPPLPDGRPGQDRAVRPQGHRALGRPGLGDRGPGALRQPRHLHRPGARAGHLLRRADHGPGAGRHGRGGPSPRVRPRRASRSNPPRPCSTACGSPATRSRSG